MKVQQDQGLRMHDVLKLSLVSYARLCIINGPTLYFAYGMKTPEGNSKINYNAARVALYAK